MKTPFKVDSIDAWILQLKGKERPIAECHKTIQRTVRRLDSLRFRPQAIIRFNSKINMVAYNEGRFVTLCLTWLRDNATSAYHYDSRGPRIFLESDDDAVLFKLTFISHTGKEIV